MSKYGETEERIIVGGGKTKAIYFTPAVIKRLGKPTHVSIATRGNNIAFMAAAEEDGGYTVAYVDGNNEKVAPHINAIAIVRAYNLASGVYECHYEGGANGTGMIVFDSAQPPSRL